MTVEWLREELKKFPVDSEVSLLSGWILMTEGAGKTQVIDDTTIHGDVFGLIAYGILERSGGPLVKTFTPPLDSDIFIRDHC